MHIQEQATWLREWQSLIFHKREPPEFPATVPSPAEEEIHGVNKEVKHAVEQDKMSKKG